MLTMQAALLGLADFWAARGCAVVQPFNSEVGAGTMNPATYLRVLGPEPWGVAYVEPSVRPDDSRYGDNPNRLQAHTQFQVILKPEPGNPQELYLESLAAIGIDVAAHDIRFVEDNWESPALGAWGLGWEVWLDGQEITQFTYFQQAGGLVLDPPATEITYGMERILMALHAVDHFKDIPYTETLSYGELFAQNEFEWSTFYLDVADVDLLRRQFTDFEAEARRLVDAKLPIPAHAQLLKCSHTFNVLDSRKAMGTTERASAFSQMRSLAHDVAELWLASREELTFPLGRADVADAAPTVAPAAAPTTEPSTLFLELGVEELPAADVSHGIALLEAELPKRLEAARLAHGAVTVIGTPRRLIATVADVAPNQEDVDQVVRGPKVSAAFDAEGNPTKAAEGFARSRGTTVAELSRVTEDGNEHLAFASHVAGLPAAEALAELVPGLLDSLRFGRNMRWRPGPDAIAFSRPVRWLAVLLGAEVVPATWAGLAAGRATRLFRSTGEPTATYADADTAVATLAAAGITADPAQRRSAIVEGALALAASVGGTIDTDRWARLIDEVVNLVEDPTPVLGSFREDHLALPPEVLTSVMTKHQRYLPVSDAEGNLLPHFVTVANGSIEPEVVRRGNQAVIEARYADAAFFVARDLATPVQQFADELGSLTFDSRLGSVRDRVDRIAAVALDLAATLAIDGDALAVVQQAGPLVKFDLASSMVIEMSSLAGTMALHYARAADLPEAVAVAIFEDELPRSSGDLVPSTLPGAVLALSDRFDLITALYAVGAEPTGSADPYGLRRAARGLLVIAMSGIDPALEEVSISEGIALAASHLPVEASAADLQAKIGPFVQKRFTQTLAELGFRHDLVRASLLHGDHPARVIAVLRQLTDQVGSPEFSLVADGLKRAGNLLAKTDRAALPKPDPAHFETASAEVEQGLLDALAAFSPAGTGLDAFVDAAAPVATALNAFVDAVKVNADDPAVKANRLALVAQVHALGEGIVAWSEIE
ncbi:glycine--tRNA ligase subunit beta [Aquihabitans sp. G128]|nr:glycine--tRNA ligase subunit beta [Aquihabitans sp. G128]